MLRKIKKGNDNRLMLSLFAMLLFFSLSSLTVKAEDPEIHHLEGEMLKKKLIYVNNYKVIPGYEPEKVESIDPSGRTYKGYKYKLTPLQRDKTGSIYLEDRLDLKYSFKMTGYINIDTNEYPNSLYSPFHKPADGIGIVFHGDDEKFVGHYGSSLGIIGLKDAIGLAFDTYNNSNEGDILYERTRYVPGIGNAKYYNAYTQMWTTRDRYGLLRLDESIEADRQVVFNKHYTKVDMEYDATPSKRELKFTVHLAKADSGYPGGTRVHTAKVPKTMDYVYFSTSAATGDFYSSHNFVVESIDYVPYRTRKVVYRDIETGKNITPPTGADTEITGFVGQEYELKAKIPKDYELVNIEGKLKGTFQLDELISDQIVYLNFRKERISNSYEFLFEENDFTRNDQEPLGSKLTLTPFQNTFFDGLYSSIDRVKYLAIESPRGVSISSEKYPSTEIASKWHKIVYETDSKTVTQYFNAGESANGLELTDGMTTAQARTFMKNMTFRVDPDIDVSLLDNTQIEYKADSRPIIKYVENNKESFYKVVNHYYNDNSSKLVSINSNEANYLSKVYNYRGITGQLASGETQGEKIFINQLVPADNPDKVAWIANGGYVDGNDIPQAQPQDIKRFIVEFDKKTSVPLTGYEPSFNAGTLPFVPQPVMAEYVDTRGNVINNMSHEYLATSNYKIDGNVLANKNSAKQITGFTFEKLGNNEQFPIKASKQTKKVQLIYDSLNPHMRVRYLQLDRDGKETELPVYENLEKKIKKIDDQKYAPKNTPIIDHAPELEFEGYTIDSSKTTRKINSTNADITNGKVPYEDFTITYYYKPEESISLPKNLDFGGNNKGEKDTIIGLTENQPSHINIINTYENTGWELMASTTGMTSLDDGSYLLADILFKEDGNAKKIKNGSTPISNLKVALKTNIPLSSTDGKNGLYIQTLKKETGTHYKGTIKFSFQNVP